MLLVIVAVLVEAVVEAVVVVVVVVEWRLKTVVVYTTTESGWNPHGKLHWLLLVYECTLIKLLRI